MSGMKYGGTEVRNDGTKNIIAMYILYSGSAM